MAVLGHIYDNWGNIHDLECYFDELVPRYEMTTTAGTIGILEPIGWKDVPFKHKRDEDLHGFNYELVGGDINLEFDCDSGMSAIRVEYDLNGNDGDVIFRRVFDYESEEIIEYEGRLILSEMTEKDFTIACPLERKSLYQLLKSRMDTKVNLSDTHDLDQNDIASTPSETLILTGQELTERYESFHDIPRSEPYTETRTSDSSVSVFFDFNDPTVNTIHGFLGNFLSISGDSTAGFHEGFYLFDFEANGEYSVEVELDFQVTVRINPQIFGFGKKITKAYVNVILNIMSGPEDSPTVVSQIIYASEIYEPNVQGFAYPRVNVTWSGDIVVNNGNRLSISAAVKYTHNAHKLKSVNVLVDQYKVGLKLSGFSELEPSYHMATMIKESMEGALLRITGQSDILRTDYYSREDGEHPTAGCGSMRLLMSGKQVRSQIHEGPERPVFTFKELLSSMYAIDTAAMGIEWDPVEKKELIRVEQMGYFYQDIEVFDLGEVFDYSLKTAKEKIYNKVSIGYEKYKEEEENSLDEIHAYHEYQTPIKTEANEYLQKSKFNASGYLVEVLRRLSLSDKNEGSNYDDDVFIVHVKENVGGITDGTFSPVTDEPFDEVDHIVSPSTTINLTLTVKRMLMKHARWLMGALRYKSLSDVIKNTLTKQNGEFTTTIKADYECKDGDVAGLPLVAKADIILNDFGDATGIFSPEWAMFKCRLQLEQIRYIINAHRGISVDDNNYGYLTYTDPYGVVRKGWLYDLTYNPIEEEAEFRLLKKKFP